MAPSIIAPTPHLPTQNPQRLHSGPFNQGYPPQPHSTIFIWLTIPPFTMNWILREWPCLILCLLEASIFLIPSSITSHTAQSDQSSQAACPIRWKASWLLFLFFKMCNSVTKAHKCDPNIFLLFASLLCARLDLSPLLLPNTVPPCSLFLPHPLPLPHPPPPGGGAVCKAL